VVAHRAGSYVATHGGRLTSPRSVRFGLAQDLAQLSDKTKRPQQTVNLRPPARLGYAAPPINLPITRGRRTNRGKLNDECRKAMGGGFASPR
jgi:hypothetical protein